MRIILLSGKQGSGKSTLQEALRLAINAQPESAALPANFADILYEMHDEVRAVAKHYGIPLVQPKDGVLLQLLGTEWGRKTLGENVWVDALKNYLARMESAHGKNVKNLTAIVGDCRFENEFDAFPEAFKVRLRASTDVRKARCSMWRPNDQHPSEIGLDAYDNANRFDLVLDTNEGSVDSCVEKILERFALKAGDRG